MMILSTIMIIVNRDGRRGRGDSSGYGAGDEGGKERGEIGIKNVTRRRSLIVEMKSCMATIF